MDNCPGCGSQKIYNSGFTIECGTPKCHNYSQKQELCVLGERTRELRAYVDNDSAQPDTKADAHVCLDTAVAAESLTDLDDAIDIILRSQLEVDNYLYDWQEFRDSREHEPYPFRKSTWMAECLAEVEKLKTEIIQEMGTSSGLVEHWVSSREKDSTFWYRAGVRDRKLGRGLITPTVVQKRSKEYGVPYSAEQSRYMSLCHSNGWHAADSFPEEV